MVANNLERSRHLRISAEHDDTLQRLARAEGCSVSDLIRRAVIRTFFVADDATPRSEIMDTVASMPEHHTTSSPNGVSGDTPTNGNNVGSGPVASNVSNNGRASAASD